MRNPNFFKIVSRCTAGIALFLACTSNIFGASANLVVLDKSTQGTWKGVYGADGLNIPQMGGTFPAYANVTVSGASQWVWNYNSQDSAAVQKPSGTDRIASCWYAPSSYTFDVNLTDGQAHRVAMYCLDWDAGGRQQTVTVTDAANGTVLSSQTIADFSRGVWLVWDVTGRVTINVRAVAGNAVASGLFFGGTTAGTPAPAQVTAPVIFPFGGTFTNATQVTITNGTATSTIRYTTDGTDPTGSSTIYSGPITLTSSATIKAKATAPGMTDSLVKSATFTIVTASPSSGTAATFVARDTATQGNWRGAYGSDGLNIPQLGGTFPSYANVTFSGASQWVWNYTSSDAAALQKLSGTDRIASCWYAASGFSMDVTITDGQTHRLALYCLDWDVAGRQETVTLTDTATGSTLNAQTITDFSRGVWLVWDIRGRVTVSVRPSVGNGVVGGVFFGGTPSVPSSPAVAAAPVVSPAGGSFTSSAQVTMSSSTPGAAIRYTTDGVTPTSSSAVYTGAITLTSSTVLKARSFAPGLVDSSVTTASFTITPPPQSSGSSATFVTQDTTTRGNWAGTYGGDGLNIPNQGGSFPAYANVSLSGASPWVWNYNSTDISALQKVSGSDRVASCWYGAPAYSFDINLTDGQTHRVALYCLDWDGLNRQESATITDFATGAVLNSQTVSGFQRGTWLVWDVRGHVVLTLRTLGANNAVSSGLFFGLGGANPNPVQQTAAPVITPPGGNFAGPTSVTISSATAGATIRYTVDGTDPTTSSTVYASPLTPSTAITIKARAFKSGMTDSEVTTAVFNISNPTPPPSNLPDLANLPNRVFPSPEGFNTVQYAPNGALGFIVWRDQQLIFRERTASGAWTEDIVSNGGNVFQMLTTFSYYGPREDYRFQPSAVLLYDSASQAHVFQANGRNINHYLHVPGGWQQTETILASLANDNIAVLIGSVGPNNAFHLAALTAASPRSLTYASNKTGSWNWSSISTVTDTPLSYWAPPYAPRWLSLAADSRNNAHITFRTSMDLTYDSAGHPRAYSELKYASNTSGQWTIGLVQKPDDVSAEAANGASIAIGSDDRPRIASWYNDRGDGGSSSESRLYYHEPDGAGGWTHTVVLNSPDGYSAGDGPKGTGFSPYLRFDNAGRPHILFLDHAGEHFGGIGQQEYAGNLRHAWRNGTTWSVENIYRQTSPLDREIVYPAFAMSGNEMAVTLLQRETKWNLSSFPPLSNSTYYFRFFTKPLP